MSYRTGRIEKCTDNRPPFRTSEYVDGNRPHYAHTSNGVKLTAPLALLQIVGDASLTIFQWQKPTTSLAG